MDSLFTHSIAVHPPLSEEALAAVPAKRGVLLLAGEGDTPIVLLTAADIRARLRNRLAQPPDELRKAADLRHITRKILFTLAPSHVEADLTFLELARTLFPDSFTELLSWRRAWLVQVNPAAEFPRFSRTHCVGAVEIRQPARDGLTLGPFPSGQAAQQFIETVEDLFDLCRDYACLRQAPNGPACAYLQMGRCTGPCNGTISLEAYRRQVAEAADFAAGNREPFLATLRQRMQQAADATEFERAGRFKKRLERARALDHAEFAHVRPIGQWRFILVQPASSKKWQDVFLAVGPAVTKIAPLSKTPTEDQLAATLSAMAQACGTGVSSARPASILPAPGEDDVVSSSGLANGSHNAGETPAPRGRGIPTAPADADLYRLGLLAHYLFSSPAKRGVIVHYTSAMTPQELAEQIKQQTL